MCNAYRVPAKKAEGQLKGPVHEMGLATAAQAVTRYSVLYTAALLLKAVEQGKAEEVLEILAASSEAIELLKVIPSIPSPDFERFVVQPDGTVTFVPPMESGT